MIRSRLANFIDKNRCTLLGVGPMSVNCVDVAIDLANEYSVPIMLIASRRQIDSDEFGGGYVNNWSTEEFVRYVQSKDKKGQIIPARDHGGPWQNTQEVEQNLGLRKAMDSAKLSFAEDIRAGMQVIHIDPSIDIHGQPDLEEVLFRLYELYDFCCGEALRSQKDLTFEIGTEEQSGGTNTEEELTYLLEKLTDFCAKNKYQFPTFVVVQSGTKVMEMRNVGSFDVPLRIENELPAEIQIPKMVRLCDRFGIFMKEHNTDYLSDEALRWHPRLGIHASNVAPEFGVAETRALIKLAADNGKSSWVNRFVELSLASKKWQKWMLSETTASDLDKATIAGHYIFSTMEFKELKSELEVDLKRKTLDVDDFLRQSVRTAMMRYLINFGLVSR